MANSGKAAGKSKPSKAPDVIITDVAGVERAIADACGQPGARGVLLNVWATWCEPCREEMPDLLRFARDPAARGVHLLLVSADPSSEKQAVAQYLASLGATFPSYLKTGDDMAFINALDPKWDGTIPASFLFDVTGQRMHRWRGKVTYAELMARTRALEPVPTGNSGSKSKRRQP